MWCAMHDFEFEALHELRTIQTVILQRNILYPHPPVRTNADTGDKA